ncbi:MULTISPECIES: signal peptidase II [unclassified Phenylobacterium]|uniref:signal peptidase II n=1 Tax=unclassified Phenylobacterium TaxID=2640670 RepID=UPI00083A38D7|nr:MULTISPECIES: signal peptidase II [unclassified Phenylobacterium]
MARRSLGVAIVLGVVAVDQATKGLARATLASASVELAPFFDLRLGFNSGVSFGLFAGESAWARWALVAVTGLVAVWLLAWLFREANALTAAALALILGGALGNLLDRVRVGVVTDFLDLHLGEAHFPTFNLADTAITAGVVLMMLGFRRGDESSGARASASHDRR